MGRPIDPTECARIFLALQKNGAANINLVTGSHFAPTIVEALGLAKAEGLSLPILWNCSGYESLDTLELLAPWVDVWLPDLKTLDPSCAQAIFRAPDYPQVAREAILRMTQLAPLRYRGRALVGGVVVRHLCLPGRLEESRAVLEWFSSSIKERALLSLMTQYTPLTTPEAADAPARYLSETEAEALVAMLDDLGIEEGFCQDLVPGSDWLPDFSSPQAFPGGLAKTVWHWRDGYLV